MIAMLISDKSPAERSAIKKTAKDMAALYTEDFWNWIECAALRQLQAYIDNDEPVNLYCLDLTMKGSIECASVIRKKSPSSFLILIADTTISPITYMKPSIRAESLMLKPLTWGQVRQVLREAISSYAEKYIQNDDENVFTIDYKGERTLFEYSRICYFEAREKKVFVNTGDEEYAFSDTLDRLEEALSGRFLRCHRGFLVNRDKIRQVYISQNRLVLNDEIEIPLSRSYKPAVKEFMEGRKDGTTQENKLDHIL